MLKFLTLACGLLMPFVVRWLKNCAWPDWGCTLKVSNDLMDE